MDLRTLALTLFLAACGAGAARANGPEAASGDSLPRSEQAEPRTATWDDFDLQETALDYNLDAATLAELDDLALDPVRLNDGDLERLHAIPWLGRRAIEAVRQARPLASLRDLGRLPGWSSDLARRVAPFVVLGAARRVEAADWEAEVRSRLLRKGREWRLHLADGEAIACRILARPSTRSGYLQARGRGWKAVAGDLRLGHAQGLLAWTAVVEPRAESAPLRRGRGLVGSDAAATLRSARGAAFEMRPGSARLVFAAGGLVKEPIVASLAELGLGPRVSLQVAGVRVGGRGAASLGLQLASAVGEVAFEVGGRPSGAAGAVALQMRAGGGRLEARLQATPEHYAPALAALSGTERRRATRLAQLALGGRRGGIDLECDLLQSSRCDSMGDRGEATESALRFEWRDAGTQVVLRLRHRESRRQRIDEEGLGSPDRERTRTLSGGVRHDLGPGWRAAVDFRQSEHPATSGSDSAGAGRGWQMRIERAAGKLRGGLSVASFSAAGGAPSLLLPELGVGVGEATTWWASGDGLRLATALRLQASRCDLGLRLGCLWTAGRAPRQSVAATVTLRYP